ncbi:hypothetical protein BX659_106105 [Orenia metallireducens]|uniref:Uncharacterized protein n=1 Tax=Orenia metallireducens TaxID=1413210 RepID=A0A285GWU3_9FIRM|nr:hypothetical protein [Orenia metallireducens]PRX31072.1 hypothetical protein BX659_106105 [Orenia metallireducens]SNY27764.1 hypothetical protein SAMN06265827_11182 [Orenia metallireducens]
MKKLLIVISLLLMLLSTFTIYAMSSSKIMTEGLKEGYHSLGGTIYEEGTGTISLLIFKGYDGNRYLITGDLKDRLRSLKGLPLVLTGKVEDVNLEGKLTQAKLKVKLYDVEYSNDYKEVSVLGTLEEDKEGLVLLTKKQKVIRLDSDTYHSLDKYLGEEIVINGFLEELTNYQAKMEVKSYRSLD